FMSQFGTDTKPLHAGFAASGGVQSALFASAGLSAGSDTLHGATGLRHLMVGPDVDQLADEMRGKAEHGQTVTFRQEDVGDPLHIIHHGLKIKQFPNCGSVHRALDGLLELRAAHQFTAETVDTIHVRAPATHLRNLMYDDPQTPAEAKFSLEYNLAVGLLQGRVGLADFDLKAIQRAEIRALFSKITKDYVEALESDFPTEVHVRLSTGETYMTSQKMPIGSRERPLSDAQLWQKFEGCVAATPNFKKADDVRQLLQALESNPSVRKLMDALKGA
ncbi:MAG: hypothetical protein AAGK23_08650, partial [Pseudomonadota bacterium]